MVLCCCVVCVMVWCSVRDLIVLLFGVGCCFVLVCFDACGVYCVVVLLWFPCVLLYCVVLDWCVLI